MVDNKGLNEYDREDSEFDLISALTSQGKPGFWEDSGVLTRLVGTRQRGGKCHLRRSEQMNEMMRCGANRLE